MVGRHDLAHAHARLPAKVVSGDVFGLDIFRTHDDHDRWIWRRRAGMWKGKNKDVCMCVIPAIARSIEIKPYYIYPTGRFQRTDHLFLLHAHRNPHFRFRAWPGEMYTVFCVDLIGTIFH